MLSVVPIKTSSVESGYYLKQDGNYYIEDMNENELYQWMGEGAKKLGLVGSINAKDHSDIYNGILPGNTVVGKRNEDGSLAGRPGYDLTFSMSKEISLIICCTKDKALKDYFLNAHIHAVKTAMNEVEKMVSARKTMNGVTAYELTKNMIASLCTHFSSRAGDPQIHTHVLVANMTQRLDGQWRALSTDMQRKNGFYEKVRDNATFLGHIYQNEMARAAKEKGFDVTPVNKHGMFAIQSFPEDIRQHFSKRRNQILTIIDSLKYADKEVKKLYDHVAQNSKDAKEKINNHDFMEKSKSNMKQFLDVHHTGKNFDGILKSCINEKTKSPISLTEKSNEAVIDAIKSLSRFSVKMDANKIIEKAMQFDFGSSSMAQIQLSLNNMIKNGKLHQTDSGHFTAQDLIETEKRIIRQIDKTKREVEGSDSIKPATTVNEAFQHSRLCIIEEPKRLDAKLKLIDSLVNELESSGKKVRILTQTKTSADSHNDHNRGEQKSIWQQLKSLGKSDRAHSLAGFLHRHDDSTSNPIANALTRKGKEVFLIDGSSHLNLDMAEKLFTLTEKRQANLIFLSYEEGKQGYFSGNIISLLKKSGVHIIKTPVDNVKKQIQEAIVTTHEIKSGLNDNSNKKQFDRQKMIAEQVVKQYGVKLNDVDILSNTKKSADKQTELIREELKRHQHIHHEEQKIIIEHRVYLSDEEKKHAKFFKGGWVAKTYIGRGQFAEKTILEIDEKNNRLLITSNFGRKKYVSPEKLLHNTETKLIEKKHLFLATNDRIKLNTDNRISKQLGVSSNTSYRVTLQDKKIILVCEQDKYKTIKTNITNLNGLSLSYDYVKSVHDIQRVKSLQQRVFLDAPVYSLNKNMIQELSRQYTHIDIYTDDRNKAEKKITIEKNKPLASEIPCIPYQGDLSVIKKAVNYGISVIASREAAFTYQSVIKKSLAYSAAQVGFTEIQSELRERVRLGELMVRQSPAGDILLAMKETVLLEQSIINQIKDGKNAVTPFLSQEEIKQKLDGSALTQGQKSACALLATTSDRFVMVQGYAGTGKSTMLQTLQEALNESGVVNKQSIIALAPTHKAVKELQLKGIEAQTLKSFLVDEMNLASNNYQHLENKLILLDESSMVSNRDFQQLQSIVEKARNCHCAYIGDKAQLLSVENGKPSELAYISSEANIKTATMDEILRQKNPELKKITQELTLSTPESVERALTRMDQNGWIVDASKVDSKEKFDPIKKIAEQYCALSIEERTNTVIAAATNENRKSINNEIRSIRKEKGELHGEGVFSTILTDSRLTEAELRHCENYRSGDVVKLNNQYLGVVETDRDNNTLLLQDHEKQSRAFNLDLIPTNSTLELFHRNTIQIQSGDVLKWTKSDKEREITAHENLLVKEVTQAKNSLTVTSQDGKHLTINLNHPENQHIDYHYASTVHGLQGATAKSAMILLDAKNSVSNTMRLLYVAVTRATHDVRIFTHSFSAVRDQITHNKGDKTSALEAMDLLKIKESVVSKTSPLNITPDKKERIDAKLVEDKLRDQVQHVCENLFGKPNSALSNTTHWRYGNKGSLSVVVAGQYQGSFHHFETGEKGGMIKLLMSELSLDFKSALEQGHQMLGGDLSIKPKIKINTPELSPVKDDIATRKRDYIHALIKQSTPLNGTLAEKYLNDRAIKNASSADLRFIKNMNTGKGNESIKLYASALLAIARDKAGMPQAIQVTYLDPKSGAKIEDLNVKKRTIGSLKEATVNLTPEVKSPKMTFIAEGIETALSIKEAIPSDQKDHVQVLAALGKSNLGKIADERSANNIVIVLDNDKQDWREDKSIKSAIAHLGQNGKTVVCIQPNSINNQKTDYNDLAKAGRFDEIRKDINQGMDQLKRAYKTDIDRANTQQDQKVDKVITKNPPADREIIG